MGICTVTVQVPLFPDARQKELFDELRHARTRAHIVGWVWWLPSPLAWVLSVLLGVGASLSGLFSAWLQTKWGIEVTP
jgi:hypothetical protein